MCREIVGRYGGTIEKFIGDAVMAVWGTPIAQEDDAERAVRAALDLVDAVRRLGEGADVPDLALRAGVLTGEAAVTLGASDMGMVAGDLVNTASRLQSVGGSRDRARRRLDAARIGRRDRLRARRGPGAEGQGAAGRRLARAARRRQARRRRTKRAARGAVRRPRGASSS